MTLLTREQAQVQNAKNIREKVSELNVLLRQAANLALEVQLEVETVAIMPTTQRELEVLALRCSVSKML